MVYFFAEGGVVAEVELVARVHLPDDAGTAPEDGAVHVGPPLAVPGIGAAPAAGLVDALRRHVGLQHAVFSDVEGATQVDSVAEVQDIRAAQLRLEGIGPRGAVACPFPVEVIELELRFNEPVIPELNILPASTEEPTAHWV